MGRGRTIASNRGTPASGSENPSSLVNINPSFYTTMYVGETSEVPSSTTDLLEPLQGKVLQFFSVAGEKGVIFFEPLGRRDETKLINPATSPTDFQDVDFSANAVGFAGAQEFGRGVSFGLSLAYLRGSLAQTLHQAGVPDQSELDTGDGVRLNLGFRKPTGPAMWGLVLQNFPGFLWWKSHKRQILPVRIRAGNTMRVKPGTLFSLEFERRYYHEGSDKQDFIYSGFESKVAEQFWFRVGAFTDEINESDNHHYTGGVSFKSHAGVELSYGIERFKIDDEKVLKSYISLVLPFVSGDFDAS